VLPRIIFDTSGINALEDGGADSAPLMRSLAWEFDTIPTFTNAEELISTQSPARRESLICRFERLLRPGKSIVPPTEIIQRMILTHAAAPTRFDWTKVDIKVPWGFEEIIAQRDGLDDEFCAEQRTGQLRVEKEFKDLWKGLRPGLDEISPEDGPASYEEVAKISVVDDFVSNLGRGIYQSVSGKQLTDPELNEFAIGCPPVCAIYWGQVMAFYVWSFRGQSRAPGRNDLMMAGYLPYCDKFVTHDGPQREALREIASRLEIACQVLSFEEFRDAASKS
jgi:hypothetical protein